jgi:putative transposase
MKKSKFTEVQITFALRQAEQGTRVSEVCRKMDISEATFYNRKKKYGGLGVSELRRLRKLEEENRRPKQLVADLSLDKQMLQACNQKKALKARQKRELVIFLLDEYRVSLRRACSDIPFRRQTSYYKAADRDDQAVKVRMKEIAASRVRYGFWRILTLLRREGWRDNHK